MQTESIPASVLPCCRQGRRDDLVLRNRLRLLWPLNLQHYVLIIYRTKYAI